MAYEWARGWRIGALLVSKDVRNTSAEQGVEIGPNALGVPSRHKHHLETIVQLNSTSCSFPCVWCLVATIHSIRCYAHAAGKGLDVNCRPLSIKNFVGILKFLTQCSSMIAATAAAVVYSVSIVLVSIKKRSASRRKYWRTLQFLVKCPVWWRWWTQKIQMRGTTKIFLVDFFLPATYTPLPIPGLSLDVVCYVRLITLGTHYVLHVTSTWIFCQCRLLAWVRFQKAVSGWYAYLACIIVEWQAGEGHVCVHGEVTLSSVDYFCDLPVFKAHVLGMKLFLKG